jgi:hypothetical protein
MSFAGNVLGFENFNLKNTWKKLKDNPWRALVGSTTGVGTKLWNKVLDRNDEPLVNDWGGAPKDSYQKAQAAGIDTSSGKTMHNIAQVVASFYAGGYGASQLGAAGGAAGAGGTQASVGTGLGGAIGEGALGAGAGTVGAGTAGGYGGAVAGGSLGGGAALAAGGGGGSAAPVAGSAPMWQRFMRAGMQNMGGGGGQQPNQGLEAGQEMLRRRQEEEQRRQEEEQRRQVEQAMLLAQTQPQQQPRGFM